MSKRLPKCIYIDANLLFTDQPLMHQIDRTADYFETLPDLQVLYYLADAIYSYEGKDTIEVIIYNNQYTAMYDRFKEWWTLLGTPSVTRCIANCPDKKDLHKKDVIFMSTKLNDPVYRMEPIRAQKVPIMIGYVDIMRKSIRKVVNMW